MSKVTIVMYHYVRDLQHSRYPDIKALEVDLFKEQLLYFQKHYIFIKMEELIEALQLNKETPDNSLLLTFDDGYKDHFEFVFPLLDELKIQGCFFPSAKAILENCVLNVNKIHFIIASVKEKDQLISDIVTLIKQYSVEYNIDNKKYCIDNIVLKDERFDAREIVYIKRVLQRELPEKLRDLIVNLLFHKYVCNDESVFSRNLYMNMDQLKCMRRNGMYIGSHGYDHYWLNTLSKNEQKKEVNKSIEFLKLTGCKVDNIAFCYPYGAYNDSLLSVLRESGCSLALTTQVEVADLNVNQPLQLPRLDTNDFPKNSSAEPNEWTMKIIP
jgi:peptidoglycan/xylan/chitin deacetylase (PgdA/CDA1 family)